MPRKGLRLSDRFGRCTAIPIDAPLRHHRPNERRRRPAKSRHTPSAAESTTDAYAGRSSSSGLEASRHPYARIAPVRRFKGCGHRPHVGAEKLARRNGSAWWRSRRSSTRVDRDSLRGGPSCPGARAATKPKPKVTGTVVNALSTFRARFRVGVGGAFMLPPLRSGSRD